MTNKEKIEWVRENIKGLEKIDPYSDHEEVEKIKQELIKRKGYTDHHSAVTHQSVMNVIMKAQGLMKKKVHQATTRKARGIM